MPPVVSIVGVSESGKTTFLVKLIAELKSRGYRIATVKHTHHDQELSPPKKDTWKHIEAGSVATILNAPNGITMIKPAKKEVPFEEIARILGEDYDLILTEGFSRGDAPKIEVHRKAVGGLLKSASKRIAVITDEPLDVKGKQFGLDDVKGVADLLEEGFIKPNQESISFYVNNEPVPLTLFPRQIITNVLLAMAHSLKGVKKIKKLQIFLKQ
jgi:molybdopterin-guanine dinucleotide biosynthesis protein B